MKLKNIAIAASFLSVLALTSVAFGQSELASAAMSGQEDVVRTLISRNTDVNTVEDDGSTALQWAVYYENVNIAERLLLAGADVQAANREGMTPLIIATMAGNAELTEILLDAGAEVNFSLGGGETPLMMAARTGDIATIQILLDRGADIDRAETLRGTTALMWAAAYSNPAAVKVLLENSAAIATSSAATNDGRTDPYIAPTARLRIRNFYRARGQGGGSVALSDLEEAAPEVVLEVTREQLLERLPEGLIAELEVEIAAMEAAQINPPTAQKKKRGGLTALHFAVREGDLESAKALVDAGADVNQVSEFGWSPLLTATQNRYYQLGAYLIEQGANPNISTEGGWNPLYIATDNRNIEGGDYPTRKPDMDHMDYIMLLLNAGADTNLRMTSSTETRTIFTHQWVREEGATPFFRAAQSSDLALLEVLLEYGANPNLTNDHGVTPLMLASGIGWVDGVTYEWSEEANRETIALLIELGNDPGAQDIEDGRTALMGAAHKGRISAIELLVAAGAELDTRDIGSRDSINILAGLTWQAIDYADGLVRIGVQATVAHPEAFDRLREMMIAEDLEVPDIGRTLDSICIVDICL